MIPKKFRIERKEFPALLSSRNFFHSDYFILRTSSSFDNKPHVGVSVSKKISKKAVVRNTIRRRVYAVVFLELSRLKSNLILVVAKPGADKIKGETLKKEINNLFIKGKCL
jgi:ribonuclease P protein component